jgi:hypothetical protein
LLTTCPHRNKSVDTVVWSTPDAEVWSTLDANDARAHGTLHN